MNIQLMMLTGDNRKDAIRALMGTIKKGSESIRITDETMGMRKDFLIR